SERPRQSFELVPCLGFRIYKLTPPGSIAKDHVEQDPIIPEVLPAGNRYFRRQAELNMVTPANLIARSECDARITMTADMARPEVEKIVALEVQIARVAIGRVDQIIEFDQWVNTVQVADVVVEVQAREETVRALVVDAEVVADG